MISLRQKDFAEWQIRNFDSCELSDMIHGMSEEVGEMNHWYLKGKQHIRGVSIEQSKEEIADAFADAVIYGVQVMTCIGADAEGVLAQVFDRVLKRDWKANPTNAHKEA